MSIATDLRSYADTAVTQGRQFVDQAVEQAQAQLNDVTGQANDLFGKAAAAVTDLRAQAEKAINLDAVKTAVEPYLAQVKGYRQDVTDRVSERAESLVDTVKSDARFAKLVDAATVVVEAVQQKVVKPVQSLSGRGSKPVANPAASSKPAATKPAAKPATKAAATKPAAKPAATKPAGRKAPAKRAAKS